MLPPPHGATLVLRLRRVRATAPLKHLEDAASGTADAQSPSRSRDGSIEAARRLTCPRQSTKRSPSRSRDGSIEAVPVYFLMTLLDVSPSRSRDGSIEASAGWMRWKGSREVSVAFARRLH